MQSAIRLQCKSCGGNLTIDTQREVLICPFCGSEELIKDSDAVAVEKIRQKTTFMKWEREDAKRKEKERSAYRNSKAGIVALVFAFICGGGCIGSWDCAFDSNSKFSALFSGAKGGYSSAKAVALRRK